MAGDDSGIKKGKLSGDKAVIGCLFGVAVEFVLCVAGFILWKALDMPSIGMLLMALSIFLPVIGIIWGRKMTVEGGGKPGPE